MSHLSRHANALTQGWVWMDCFSNVDGVSPHFNGQGNLTNHVASMGTYHAAAQDFAVTVSLG